MQFKFKKNCKIGPKYAKIAIHLQPTGHPMFHKRKKQTFAPGTFIPTFPRVLAILQLCLAFTALLFAASKPFIEHHFNIKSRILLYDFVMGNNSNEIKHLFNSLESNQKEKILEGYTEIMKAGQLSFVTKLEHSLKLIFIQISAFERAWILFAVVISILLLKKVEGAKQAVWILPLIAFGFLLQNQVNYGNFDSEEKLYPDEKFLSERYLKTDLKTLSITDQRSELLKAWNLYLIEYFAKELPSEDLEIYQSQILKGEFGFHIARIEKLPPLSIENHEKKQSLFLLAFYLIWNLMFACVTCDLKIKNKLRLRIMPS